MDLADIGAKVHWEMPEVEYLSQKLQENTIKCSWELKLITWICVAYILKFKVKFQDVGPYNTHIKITTIFENFYFKWCWVFNIIAD